MTVQARPRGPGHGAGGEHVLAVQDLTVRFRSDEDPVLALDGVSLEVSQGEVVGVVGESGCGKSTLGAAIAGLLPEAAEVCSGRVLLQGEELLTAKPRRLRDLRGRVVSVIFQEPMTALNPVMTAGRQVAEVIRRHEGVPWKTAEHRAVELLHRVGIPEPRQRARAYPHQLSGGMRQRVLIASAIACKPSLIVADEPTTALDVTVQAQVLDLMDDLRRDLGVAILLITHDLGVIAGFADRVAIMYAGRKVEEAAVDRLIDDPRHPYTRGLLKATPQAAWLLDEPVKRLKEIPGLVPSFSEPPDLCAFVSRCGRATEVCAERRPRLEPAAPGHHVACYHPGGDP